MLDESRLRSLLERFGDPSAAEFEGFARSRIEARRAFARAFAAHLADLAETAPVLAPVAASLQFSATEQAFFEALKLDAASVDHAAEDFANAWKSGVAALSAGTTVTGPSSTSFVFEAMEPLDVSARFTALRDELRDAFRTPLATRRQQLARVAGAWHRAVRGLRSTPTPFVVTYG